MIRTSKARSGFTLVELLIVIAIIAVLAALLLPALIGVISAARRAAVKTEIGSLESSIADFKTKFGKAPPSYISFNPASKTWGASKAILRSMFPEINMNLNPANGPTPLITDLTAAGLWGKELHGSECLVFFLGGIARKPDEVYRMTGFSKNPERPFKAPSPGTPRLGPFFEFKPDRLEPGAAGLVYRDSLPSQTRPFIYASTSWIGSYSPDHFLTTYTYQDAAGNSVTIPWLPYKIDGQAFYKPTSFQIISPGYDNKYGHGGWMASQSPPDRAQAPDTNDADNLTNFSEGTIGE